MTLKPRFVLQVQDVAPDNVDVEGLEVDLCLVSFQVDDKRPEHLVVPGGRLGALAFDLVGEPIHIYQTPEVGSSALFSRGHPMCFYSDCVRHFSSAVLDGFEWCHRYSVGLQPSHRRLPVAVVQLL